MGNSRNHGENSLERQHQHSDPEHIRERTALVELHESFGFFETPELVALRTAIVQAATDEQTYVRGVLTDAYQVEALLVIGDNPPLDTKHGYLIAQAVIKLEAGYDYACLDDLEDVLWSLRHSPGSSEAAEGLDHIMRGIESSNG